jgi:hypothetical protein
MDNSQLPNGKLDLELIFQNLVNKIQSEHQMKLRNQRERLLAAKLKKMIKEII